MVHICEVLQQKLVQVVWLLLFLNKVLVLSLVNEENLLQNNSKSLSLIRLIKVRLQWNRSCDGISINRNMSVWSCSLLIKFRILLFSDMRIIQGVGIYMNTIFLCFFSVLRHFFMENTWMIGIELLTWVDETLPYVDSSVLFKVCLWILGVLSQIS